MTTIVPSPAQGRRIIDQYGQKTERYWKFRQEKKSLQLFSEMSRNVPAYQKFLKENGIKSGQIKNFKDLAKVPPTTKANYFHKSSLQEVVWKNFLDKHSPVMTSTSGSTGEATYFARDEHLDWEYSILAEYFLRNGSKQGRTLFMDCFGMGVWIGGLMTYQAFRYASLRGNPLTIITPGINKKEIFHCLKKLAPQFDTVIIAGYPPFVKDVIDEASGEGVNLKKMKIRLLFAAESFSENFRNYLAGKTGIKNVYNDTMNIYGSAELGAMAFETPTSIFIRRLLLKHPKAFTALFPGHKLPTLAQYNPYFISFDEEDGQVFITADSAVPMMRYSIGDNGGTLVLSKIKEVLADNNINLEKEARAAGVELLQLPFVFVFERSDFSTKLYGAIIYPEHVREALQDRKLANVVTGKFTMLTKTDPKHNQYLEINIELKRGYKATTEHKKLCHDLIVKNLLKKNAEYKNNHASIPHKVLPKLVFWENGHELMFSSGIKQKWVKPN